MDPYNLNLNICRKNEMFLFITRMFDQFEYSSTTLTTLFTFFVF